MPKLSDAVYEAQLFRLQMKFVQRHEWALFLRQTPMFEQMLIDDGIVLCNYWFPVDDAGRLADAVARQ